MISWLLVAAAQAALGATPGDQSRPPKLKLAPFYSDRDIPHAIRDKRDYGPVSTVMDVSATGKVSNCLITESSGYAAIDALACEPMKSARFEPARDKYGQPIATKYRMTSTYDIDKYRPRTSVDLPLIVQTIPKGYRFPVQARLIFDAAGLPSDCIVTETSGSVEADEAACAYARQEFKITPPKSLSPDVTPLAVRYMRASFSTAKK